MSWYIQYLYCSVLSFGGAKEPGKALPDEFDEVKVTKRKEMLPLLRHSHNFSTQNKCSAIDLSYIVLYFLLTLKESTKEKAPKKSKLMALQTRNADAAGAQSH
jgi:hypothetical protein